MTKHQNQTLKGCMLCFSMALLASCQESELIKPQADDLTMSVVANISPVGSVTQSRYAGSDPNLVEFAEGDEIGIFVDGAEPLQWTYGASGWSAGDIVYWPDKTDEHLFQAFYPYAEGATVSSVPMPGLKDQDGTMTSLSACDFLKATTTQTYGTEGVVEFKGDGKNFVHVSSLLKLTIKGDEDLQSSTLDKISVSGKDIVAPSVYSFADDAVVLSSDETSDLLDVELGHDMNGADATFYFILNAKSDESAPVTLTLEYTTGGKTYVASMTNFAGNVFAGGMQQSYTISVKDSYLIVSGGDISPWGSGETMDDIIINGQAKE